MKLTVCIVIFVSAFVTSSFAAIARGIYNDPKYPGKCSIGDLILSPGDIVKDPTQDCGRILCGDHGAAEFQSCGVQFVEGCKLGDYIDKSLKYPDCCKRKIICD